MQGAHRSSTGGITRSIAERNFEDRCDELAVEYYDATHSGQDDMYDEISLVKMAGETDHDTVSHLKNIVSQTLQKRLTR